MAKVEVISGGRVIENVVIGTPQPTTPAGAVPPDIGFVQISTSDDRGSIWTTGEGPPTGGAGQAGDMYLDMDTGDVYRWDGTAWILQGTFAPSTDTPEEVLAKIIQVDGEGSELDADTLDGHDSTYFATEAARAATQNEVDVLEARVDSVESTNTQQGIDIDAVEAVNIAQDSRLDAIEADTTDWTEITGKPATFPPTLPIPSSGVTGLDAKQASQDAAIALRLTDAPSDGLVYGRKNATWSTVIGGAHTDDNPPAAPLQDGQLWWKSSTGAMFIWYDDGNSQQWVQVAGTLESPYPLVRATAQSRNRIVNGAMQISQENGNTPSGTSGYYAADQWNLSANHGGALSYLRTPSVTSKGSVNRLRIVINTADASMAATDYLSIMTAVEGNRVADFLYGYGAARQSILRFGWRSPAGTYTVAIRNGAANRSYVADFTVSAERANLDTEQTIVIPGDTTGTWLTDTGVGRYITFLVASGLPAGVAGSWQSGSFTRSSATSNGMATAGNIFELFDVGLYLDPDNTGLPPPWQMPDEAEEERACLRYYQRLGLHLTNPAANTATTIFRAAMRAVPAVTGGGTGFTTGNATAYSGSYFQTAQGYQNLVLSARM